MIKIALIGNEIPFYFSNILADAVYAHKTPCLLSFFNDNQDVSDLLLTYGQVITQGSSVKIHRATSLTDALREADGVIYAHDEKSSSFYHNDVSYLADIDPSCRFLGNRSPYSGIAGLVQSLRQTTAALPLCKLLLKVAPQAKTIILSTNATALIHFFAHFGLEAIGFYEEALAFGKKTATSLANNLGNDSASTITYTGLEHFTWITDILIKGKSSTLEQFKGQILADSKQPFLAKWVDLYDAVPFGDVQKMGQFLPSQPEIAPMDEVIFTETIQERKERILLMNQVAQLTLSSAEGKDAQSRLLAKVSSARPIQALFVYLGQTTEKLQGILQLNSQQQVVNLQPYAVIADELPTNITLNPQKQLPVLVSNIAIGISHWQKCVAQAGATGDWAKIREAIEEDIALEGTDRLAVYDVVRELIDHYRQLLPQFFAE